MKTFLVPVFPGTNCETETLAWLADNFDAQALPLSYQAKNLPVAANNVLGVVIPGGFSYGDYLRAGALAARSPALHLIRSLANDNVPVLGICNGFQILCEAQMLPGVLLPNAVRRHLHMTVELNVSDALSPWIPRPESSVWRALKKPDTGTLRLPISCGMGRYFARPTGQSAVPAAQTPLRYVRNEPGSEDHIAAICQGPVLGMMPHPERASDALLGSSDGLVFLAGLSENQQILPRKGSALSQFLNQSTRTQMARSHAFLETNS